MSSIATAGALAVNVLAQANGGDSVGNTGNTAQAGGRANATATASGLGIANAAARAQATGASGTALADARASRAGGLITSVIATASAPVGSTVIGEARAGIATSVANLGSGLLAIVDLGGSCPGNGSGASRTFSSSATFSLDRALLPSSQHLLIGLVQASSTGNGFDSLRFRVNVGGGAAEVDQTFTSLALALAYFSTTTLNLGNTAGFGGASLLDVLFQLDLTSQTIGDSGVEIAGAPSEISRSRQLIHQARQARRGSSVRPDLTARKSVESAVKSEKPALTLIQTSL